MVAAESCQECPAGSFKGYVGAGQRAPASAYMSCAATLLCCYMLCCYAAYTAACYAPAYYTAT
eukprot:3941650-Rhodomonas_salina.1